jgi:hypothetical protein
MIGADFSLMPGGHAFFAGCQTQLAKMVLTYPDPAFGLPFMGKDSI